VTGANAATCVGPARCIAFIVSEMTKVGDREKREHNAMRAFHW
jgi:hypothetical protein